LNDFSRPGASPNPDSPLSDNPAAQDKLTYPLAGLLTDSNSSGGRLGTPPFMGIVKDSIPWGV